MEGAKKEEPNHQVIEMEWFISNFGLINRQFCAPQRAFDLNLQPKVEK